MRILSKAVRGKDKYEDWGQPPSVIVQSPSS